LKAKVYAVMNRKGGTGKTTTAVALADGLARRAEGRSNAVLLVDLDPQGHVAQSLAIETNGRCLSQLLLDTAGFHDVLLQVPNSSGLWIAPASNQLVEAKRKLIMSRKIDGCLELALNELSGVFDYIILDCPPNLDLLQTAVYKFADAAIVPVRADYLSLQGAIQHTKDIIDAQEHGSKFAIKIIVPTFFDGRKNQHNAIIAYLRKFYGQRKVAAPIPETIRVAEAPEYGMTIFEYANSRPSDGKAQEALLAYEQLVESVG
jgi:chromosome partitioning protein